MAKGPGADNTPTCSSLRPYQRNAADPKAGDRVAVFVEGVISQGGQQPMVVLTADELAQEIDFDGHVPVYGIYFDPGMADIKPESDEQIEQIARLMRLRPDLSFHVVGHTDSQGDLGQNLALSRRRAEAVVDVLIREFAIVPARLTPTDSPVWRPSAEYPRGRPRHESAHRAGCQVNGQQA